MPAIEREPAPAEALSSQECGSLQPIVCAKGIDVGGYDVYRKTFQGQELAEVSLRGDGFTDLTLKISNDRRPLPIYADELAEPQNVLWVPDSTETLTIEVHNPGPALGFYTIEIV